MTNLDKGNGNGNYGSFEAPATYNHGLPKQNNTNHGVPQPSGGNNASGGSSGGYVGQTYGEYVEPEIYEEPYSGSAGYDGFRSPQPQTQQQRRGFEQQQQNYGTRYADPQQRYSNQQFETMGQNSPFPNQQSFDPQMNGGAGAYRSQPQQAQQPQPNVMPNYGQGQPAPNMQQAPKYCKWCASGVAYDAVVCPRCGRQIEELKQANNNIPQPQYIINNNNNNNVGMPYGYMAEPYGMKDKGLALLLSFFFGWWGAHKFYEGKIGMGILYFFTFGLFGIGNVIDFLVLLGKPKKYLP